MKPIVQRHLFIASLGLVIVSGVAMAQDHGIQAIIGNVFLQNTTPGTVQAGHASISGTFRAGQVFVQQASTGAIPVVGNNTAVGPGSAVGASFSAGQQTSVGVRGTATSLLGANAGVKGETRSVDGFGVYGRNMTVEAFAAAGVKGESLDGPGVLGVSQRGPGVRARNDAGLALDAQNVSTTKPAAQITNIGAGNTTVGLRAGTVGGTAIIGSVAATTGVTTGVLGETKSANGFGVFSNGELGATGTKSFVIDHPLDPQNRYLKHYCSEGDEPRNVYNGRVTTDRNGYATVRLPSYYASINKDPEYTLTVVDNSADFVLAKVTEEIKGNTFRIRTSKPGVQVSWRVEAVRNDRWVQRSGVDPEPKKPRELRGTYLVPSLYGQPESKAQWKSDPLPSPDNTRP